MDNETIDKLTEQKEKCEMITRQYPRMIAGAILELINNKENIEYMIIGLHQQWNPSVNMTRLDMGEENLEFEPEYLKITYNTNPKEKYYCNYEQIRYIKFKYK